MSLDNHFTQLMRIKQTPCRDLPDVNCLLEAALEITNMDPKKSIATINKKHTDAFVKIIILCEGFDKQTYIVFCKMVQHAILPTTVLPLFFTQYSKFDIPLVQ